MQAASVQSVEIRPIRTRLELEAVYQLLDQCFPVGKSYFQSRIDHDTAYDYETTWVAIADGVIASTVQVFPYPCRVESAALKVAGLGSVATLPDYRGRGLCQQILKQLTAWMKHKDYDFSLLFAVITPFYEKSGWDIVPETNYELNRENIPVAIPSRSIYNIIPFDHEAHLSDAADIYNRFNHNRTLTIERPLSYWEDMMKGQGWQEGTWCAAMKEQRIVAYGRMSKINNEELVHLEELCYMPGEEQSVFPLFHYMIGLNQTARVIQAKLTQDHSLYPLFQQWGADNKDMTYAMWKSIQLFDTLRKLMPVLEYRLQLQSATVPDFRLVISCKEQSALLIYEQHRLFIEAEFNRHEEPLAEILQSDWVRLLFQGYDPNMQIELQPGLQLNSAQPFDAVVQALFPAQHSIFYLSDKF